MGLRAKYRVSQILRRIRTPPVGAVREPPLQYLGALARGYGKIRHRIYELDGVLTKYENTFFAH